MLENKWKDIAPEVPYDFHEKFEETLQQIDEADVAGKRYKRKKIRGRVLIVAAVICAAMAVTVAAKEFFKWNDYLVKRLDPSEEHYISSRWSGVRRSSGEASFPTGM